MTDERPALSLNQKFLCSLDHGETAGALSQWYTIASGLRLRGNLDFSRDRFDEGTIAAIATQYRRVLSASVAEPRKQLVRS